MAAPREPRNFLYDNYMESDLYDRNDEYGRTTSLRDVDGPRRSALDMDLGDYSNSRSHRSQIRSRGYDLARNYEDRPVGTQANARRFADALGIPAATRQAHDYDDIDYGVPRPRLQRLSYNDYVPKLTRPGPSRLMPVRRQVVDDYDDLDSPHQQVVEVVERVRHVPQRRVQIIKKVPIQQRVIKKIIVQKRDSRDITNGVARRRHNNNNNNKGSIRIESKGHQQKRTPYISKKRFNESSSSKRNNFKRNQKPKVSGADLDRELDEYMRGPKHPRINA